MSFRSLDSQLVDREIELGDVVAVRRVRNRVGLVTGRWHDKRGVLCVQVLFLNRTVETFFASELVVTARRPETSSVGRGR